MSNFKRKKPRGPKKQRWSHRPEPDPEPDPSKSGAVNNYRKNRQKKVWAVTGNRSSLFGGRKNQKRCVYGKYATEKQAQQAMEAMEKQDASYRILFKDRWPDHQWRVEYIGKDNDQDTGS